MAIYYVYWYRDDDAHVFEPKENSASSDYAYIEADSPEEAIKIAKSDIHINSKKMWYPNFNSFRAKEVQLEEVKNSKIWKKVISNGKLI